jgi:hypothetical protein
MPVSAKNLIAKFSRGEDPGIAYRSVKQDKGSLVTCDQVVGLRVLGKVEQEAIFGIVSRVRVWDGFGRNLKLLQLVEQNAEFIWPNGVRKVWIPARGAQFRKLLGAGDYLESLLSPSGVNPGRRACGCKQRTEQDVGIDYNQHYLWRAQASDVSTSSSISSEDFEMFCCLMA